MSCALDPSIQLYDICKRIPFYDSCQFTITWVFTIKLNTDCVCLGHLAHSARCLQGNLARVAANHRARTMK